MFADDAECALKRRAQRRRPILLDIDSLGHSKLSAGRVMRNFNVLDCRNTLPKRSGQVIKDLARPWFILAGVQLPDFLTAVTKQCHVGVDIFASKHQAKHAFSKDPHCGHKILRSLWRLFLRNSCPSTVQLVSVKDANVPE